MVTQTIREWSDNCWLGLGLDLTPSLDSTPASSPGGSTPASTSTPATSTDFHSFLQAFIATKSKKETYQAKTALSVATGYSLLLARLPRESEDPQQLVLAELSPAFISILENPKPQDAAIEFRQLLRGSLEQANASDLAIERDTTLVADVATLNLVNCLRSGYWLHKPVAAVDKHTLETMIGLIHTLTPDRIALQAITSRESSNGPIVLSHVADDRAQLDASRQSKLYTGGLRTTGRDIYHAICNLRKLLGVISPVADDSLVVRKLLRYANVLNSAQGKDWLHLHSNHPYLPYYLLQEAQHILTLYCNTAMSPALRTAALEKRPILPYNFAVASSAADTIVEKLASAMMSSDLGAFSYRPILHSILHPTGKQPQDSVPPSPPPMVPQRQHQTPPPHTPGVTPPPKRAKTQGKTPTTDDLADRKTKGMLTWNPPPGGPREPPICPVRDKAPGKGKDTQERLCMPFLTVGHACPYPNCTRPHPSSLARLSTDKKRADFTKFVADTPGLAWAEGRAPPGTPL
jgi:hypothetical protein